MRLTNLVKSKNLPITLRHDKWLNENSSPVWTDQALAFAQSVLSHDVGGDRRRSTRYRSSSLGYCERQQVLKAASVRGRDHIDSTLSNIFATGNFMHLKWQMMGLTEGWLVKAEIPIDAPELNFGGTIDGEVYDGSLFEFKTINDRGFKDVYSNGPKRNHVLQAHGYMLLGGYTHVSFVYENKGDGEWKEFRVERDDETDAEVRRIIATLNESYETEELPPVKSRCVDKDGYEYRNCPFRDVCLDIEGWPA